MGDDRIREVKDNDGNRYYINPSCVAAIMPGTSIGTVGPSKNRCVIILNYANQMIHIGISADDCHHQLFN